MMPSRIAEDRSRALIRDAELQRLEKVHGSRRKRRKRRMRQTAGAVASVLTFLPSSERRLTPPQDLAVLRQS